MAGRQKVGEPMQSRAFVPTLSNYKSQRDIIARGFSRQGLHIDADVAGALGELAHAAWTVQRDQYYEAGDRYRSLNRFDAEIAKDGVNVTCLEEVTSYIQLRKYNTTLGGEPREYSPLPLTIANSVGVRKLIAYHLAYLPLSQVGSKYRVNMHIIRFSAVPGRPCDTSPPGLHKDGEKYLATHLLARCGSQGGVVVITDNDRRELDRFTMTELGECYVFDDDRIWHMLTPVEVRENSLFGYRDILAFDMLPEGWAPSE
jgi:hypothetical protein